MSRDIYILHISGVFGFSRRKISKNWNVSMTGSESEINQTKYV